MDWSLFLPGLAVTLALGLLGWLVSLPLRNVNLVDSLWSAFFLAATLAYILGAAAEGPRAMLVLALVVIWSLRLASHLAWRNWGKPEDHRYRAIRANHSPGFAWKSLFIVFGLQAALAWVISLPLYAAIVATADLGMLDAVGVAVVLVGLLIETVADLQLARFRARPANRGAVLDRGLWHYSRHPNYFGEACVWWGLWLIALAGGAWWSIVASLLMTFLLVKISGVALLEKDIAERRPAYRDYLARTSPFIPWPPRRGSLADGEEHA